VLVILVDDLGYADVGCYGCKDIPTPHIDALARGGTRCTNGYVSHPFCSPTRAGLLTGRYQQRFGHENNPPYLPDNPRIGLPLDQTTLAGVLKATGYATGAVGKWHLGAHPRFHPRRRGFSEYFGMIGGGHDYFKSDPRSTREYLVPLDHNQESVALEGYLTDVLTRKAIDFVERHRAEPFFLYLAYNAPHTPLQAPAKYLERFGKIADEQRRTYAAMVSAVDDGVGQILDKLRELKLDENTLVIFLSDNGGPKMNASRNAPLRAGKGWLYEGGIRVPFIMRWSGRIPQGKTYDEPVTSLDIFPTAVALAGATPPAAIQLDGVNLTPFLTGDQKGTPHEILFWREQDARPYLKSGGAWAVRQGRYKLLKVGDAPEGLYDLAADLGETKDLAADQPERVAQLRKAYRAWDVQLVAPLWPQR
jgi:arylsulfatase A-like enzyme